MGEDVDLLARFVRFPSYIYPYLSADRLVADALKDSINELKKEDEMRMSRHVSAEPQGGPHSHGEATRLSPPASRKNFQHFVRLKKSGSLS